MHQVLNNIKELMRKPFSFLFRMLVEPRSPNEDVARREFILNILLLASLALSAAAFLSVLYGVLVEGANYQGDSPASLLLILVLFGGLLVLSRKGFVKIASYGLVVLYALPISYGLYYYGVDQPQTLLSYAVVTVITGILLGTRAAFASTLLAAAVIIVLGYAQIRGVLPPHAYWKAEILRMDEVIIFSITLGVLIVVSWLSNREIERSLTRARAAEYNLRTERDFLEIKVRERTRELEHLQLEKTEQLHHLAEFGRIASGLFHDMVNPVQAAILSIEVLKEQTLKGKCDLENYAEEASVQMKWAKDFITIARNQITKQNVRMRFDPEEQIALVFQMLSFRARREQVELVYAPHPTPLTLVGNPFSFNRLIAGLVANAVDAYEGVPDAADRMRAVMVTSKENKDSLYFEVVDNGKGISDEHQKKIFDVFFTTKGIEKGTGIGLALCRDIVEKEFGGVIGFTSKEGIGATFTIEIPKDTA